METWKPIPGYEGLYEVSDHGAVVSVKHGRRRPLKSWPLGKKGYLAVRLSNGGSSRTRQYSDIPWRTCHSLVLLAFRGPAPEGHEARHLNDNEKDNSLANLKWGTKLENAADKKANGGQVAFHGQDNPRALLTNAQAQSIRSDAPPRYSRARKEWLREMAWRYGVSVKTVYNVLEGRVY